jgi:hypothetical protein
MRYLIIIFFLTIFFQSVVSQNKTFTLLISEILSSSDFGENGRDYRWIINGYSVTNENSFHLITTNYPKLDTVVFTSNNYKTKADTIITRFYPDSVFVFTLGCCNEGFDMFLSSNYQFIKEWPEGSLGQKSKKNKLEIRTKGYRKKDSIYVIYGDYGPIPLTTGSTLLTSKNLLFKYPEKTDESNTINSLVFARLSSNDEIIEGSFIHKQFRFFGNEQLIVKYDASNNRIKIKIK